MFHFLLISLPLPWASIKMMETVGKSPESSKTIENVEFLTDRNLWNIQKATPNKPSAKCKSASSTWSIRWTSKAV